MANVEMDSDMQTFLDILNGALNNYEHSQYEKTPCRFNVDLTQQVVTLVHIESRRPECSVPLRELLSANFEELDTRGQKYKDILITMPSEKISK